MVALRQPVEVNYQTAQPIYFLDDMVGGTRRCLQSIA